MITRILLYYGSGLNSVNNFTNRILNNNDFNLPAIYHKQHKKQTGMFSISHFSDFFSAPASISSHLHIPSEPGKELCEDFESKKVDQLD